VDQADEDLRAVSHDRHLQVEYTSLKPLPKGKVPIPLLKPDDPAGSLQRLRRPGEPASSFVIWPLVAPLQTAMQLIDTMRDKRLLNQIREVASERSWSPRLGKCFA
jgi:hypothetical protein